MARSILIIVAFASIAATGALLVLMATRPEAPTALSPDPNMDILSFPPFELTAQDRSRVSREDLLGGVTIVDFFFSHCPFICPPMSQNMRLAQEGLRGTGVRLLSISVDPAHDTPERLQEYARELGADPDVWTFATGDMAVVRRILTEGLLLAPPDENPEMPINLGDGETMNNISHPSHFILVGPNAEIVSLTNGLNREQVMSLVERARAAWRELERSKR